jgi:hypothetical protein
MGIKESIRLKGVGFRMILRESWLKGRGSTPFVVLELRTSSLFSIA